MEDISKGSNTLTKNAISKFIVRFDWMATPDINIVDIVNQLSKFYDRREQNIRTNVNLTFKDNQAPGITQSQATDYRLIKESNNSVLTFIHESNAFYFETSRYVDCSIYGDSIKQVIDIIKEGKSDLKSTRIGMRFINNFHSSCIKETSKIFNSEVAKHLMFIASKEKVSRIINQEEYNLDSSKLRVVYGIPNKFYPAILNNFDLLLDIDSIDDTQESIGNWEQVLKNLNHAAYHKFVEFMLPKYLETLK